MVLHLSVVLLGKDFTHFAADLLGDLVDVLGLDHRLQAVLQQALDVGLQFTAPEVLDDLLPVRGAVEAAEVGLELARQNVQSCGLAHAVAADQPEHLTRSWNGQAVQLEGVRSVAVRRFPREVLRQIDNRDCLERALLRANAATDAQRLRDPSDLRVLVGLHTQLARAHHRAILLALLLALLGLAPVRVDDGDTKPLLIGLVVLRLLAHGCSAECVSREPCRLLQRDSQGLPLV
mmetsp:Transcript_168718/g.542189  ORF Transcript_168718/g.542189 Transcript_168718/m.542189 type:complete len:234 (-) Transcript_168718:654-1355(-)